MTMKKIDFSEIEHNQWFKEALIERAKAQYELGMRFFDGNGVRKSEKEAMKWWRRAAEKGNADAQYMLGYLYEYGYGDMRKAEKWFRKSAKNGNIRAKDALTNLNNYFIYEEEMKNN